MAHLRATISDDRACTLRIKAELEKVRESIAASEDTSGWDEEQWKRATVIWLIDTAGMHTYHAVREEIRAGTTSPIRLVAERDEDNNFSLSGEADSDQLQRLARKGGDAIDIEVYW